MDVSKRKWWVKTPDGKQGPFDEDDFQDRLRRGEIPLVAEIRSNFMGSWQPMLSVISSDETFHRPSTMPPPPPRDEE